VALDKTTGEAPDTPLQEANEPQGQASTAAGASAGRTQAAPSAAATSQPAAIDSGAQFSEDIVGEADIEFLLNQAQQALSSIDEAKDTLPPGVGRFELSDFSGTPASSEAATLDLVRDVELDVNIELGRTHMHLEDVLRLKRGSVVPLDKLAGDPVDIYVNDRLIARGEVLVLNDNFCVRVAELVVGDGTIRH
jgi:flagellar motor switch protein FliN/FliY